MLRRCFKAFRLINLRLTESLHRENMYKKRFSDWGVWKNCRRGQHDRYNDRTGEIFYGRQEHQRLTIEPKPVEQHRIQRNWRLQRKRQWETQSSVSLGALAQSYRTGPRNKSRHYDSTGDQHLTWTSPLPRIAHGSQDRNTRARSDVPLTFIMRRDSVEDFFYLAHGYYKRLIMESGAWIEHWYYNFINVSTDIFSHMDSGLRLLHKNHKDSWIWLSNACSQVEASLKEPSVELVWKILYHFDSATWSKFPEVRSALLHFFAAMARKCLGPGHNLAEMTAILCQGAAFEAVRLAFPRLLLDAVSIRPKVWDKLFITVSLLHSRRDPDDVQTVTEVYGPGEEVIPFGGFRFLGSPKIQKSQKSQGVIISHLRTCKSLENVSSTRLTTATRCL